jgi:hypothetical protein
LPDYPDISAALLGHARSVFDEDLGLSGSGAVERAGFAKLTTEVALGHAGIVLGIEVSRLAGNNADWHRLIELCGLTDTLIGDADGIYQPCAQVARRAVARRLRQSGNSPRVRSVTFVPYTRRIYGRIFQVISGFGLSGSLAQMRTPHAMPGRRVGTLLTASFRFPLAVRQAVPTTRVRRGLSPPSQRPDTTPATAHVPIGIGGDHTDRSPATPPGMRVRTGRFGKLRS